MMNLKEICQAWMIGEDLNIQEISQGFMNKTYSIYTGDQSYILRIYESDNDLNRVRREYRILEYLINIQPSFAVPTFLINKLGDYVYQDNGIVAILMPRLKGESPDMSDPIQAFEAGKAFGELNKSLANLEGDFYKNNDRNSSYEEYRQFHPKITNIEEVIDRLPTTTSKKRELHEIFVHLQVELESSYLHLPKQFIHGDGTPGNILFVDGKVTGIIDFEFCCYDARVMDLAISLGGGPTALWEYDPELNNIKMFTKGFVSQSPLSEQELLSIPYLIRLRRGAMFVYFCARYQKGLDDESWIRGIVDWVIDCEKWLKENNTKLVEKIREGIRI
jgi:homoserine kinase type II